MKRALAGLLALVPALAAAQGAEVLRGIGDVIQTIQKRIPAPSPLYISPLSSNPFDLSPLPPEPSRNPGPSTVPAPVDPRHVIILYSGGQREREDGVLSAFADDKGQVQILARGYLLEADNIDWNRSTAVFILRGNAKLTGSGAVVKARRIIVDTRNRTYEAYDGDADLKPSLVGGLLLSDIYVQGEHSNGTETRSWATNARITTCRYEVPHFELDARSLDARFERRVILRDVTFVLLQRPLFSLPFLVLPLNNRSYQNLPVFGRDPVEGYYAKTHYGIPLAGDQALYSRLDYFSRLGLGLGGDYFYNHPSKKDPFQGQFSLYGVTGPGTVQLQEVHAGSAGPLKFNIQNSYNKNDYLIAPSSTTESTRINLTLPNKFGTSGLTFARNNNSSPGFSSLQQSLGFTDSERWKSGLSANLQLNYNDSTSSFAGSSSTNSSRQTVDINFRAEDDLKVASALLEYQRSVPIGAIQNFLSPTDRTPNVTLQTDSRMLFGPSGGLGFPFKTSLSIGQFADPTSGGSEITRDRFAFSFDKATNQASRAVFDLNGLFNQGFYSDNTAQYVLGVGGSMSYRLGRDTSWNLRYYYIRPEGFSPLGIDQTGKQNLVTEDLSFRPTRSVLLGVQTGYDALQPAQGLTPWQPVGLKGEYTPTKDVLFRSLTTYDPFIKGFANLRFDLSYKRESAFLGLSGWYDNTRHIWTQTNVFINALKIGRTKIDLRANYNGYSKQFDSRQLGITYDLHDAELVFQLINNAIGYNNGTQIVLFLRLKAFPFDTNFGAGNRGQAIGTGTGIGF